MTEEEAGLDLTEENVEATLDEIRPYLAGTGGGELELDAIEEPIVKIRLSGTRRERHDRERRGHPEASREDAQHRRSTAAVRRRAREIFVDGRRKRRANRNVRRASAYSCPSHVIDSRLESDSKTRLGLGACVVSPTLGQSISREPVAAHRRGSSPSEPTTARARARASSARGGWRVSPNARPRSSETGRETSSCRSGSPCASRRSSGARGDPRRRRFADDVSPDVPPRARG